MDTNQRHTGPTDDESIRDPRHCEHVHDGGVRCKGWKVLGESLCSGHLGRGVAASPDAARAAQRKGAERRSQMLRETRKRPADVYRDAVTTHAEEFVRARLSIIRDERSPASDRLKAMEQLEARALGKPVQPTEDMTPPAPTSRDELSRLTLDQLIALRHQHGQRIVDSS